MSTSIIGDSTVESPLIDSGMICTEDFRSDPESPMDSTKSNVFLSREVSVDSENSSAIKNTSITDGLNSSLPNTTNERESKSSTSSDKKSVKTILREFLPSDKTVQPLQSPIPSNEHLSLPIGCLPILVHDQDFSSIIAYCLASCDYKKKLESLSFCDIHRRSYDATTDTEDASSSAPNNKENEKEKKSKATQTHVEMNFHDSTTSTQFTCKVYFARDFDSMRNKLLSLSSSNDDNVKTSFYRMHSENDGKSSKDFDRKSSNNSLTNDMTKSDEKSDDTQKKELEKVRAAFIRSLSKSVRWEARGGKSGSKFCKTMGMSFFFTRILTFHHENYHFSFY